MEYKPCASEINTEGVYTAPQKIGCDATQTQTQKGQDVWSQTIGLYNGYRYDICQGTSGTKDRILSQHTEVWNQQALIGEGEIKPEPS